MTRLLAVGLCFGALILAPIRGEAAVPEPSYTCAGDCDGRGAVDVDELVHLVGLSLGDGSAEACISADADGDAQVQRADVVAAVESALRGCHDDARSRLVAEVIAPLAAANGPAASVLVSQGDRVVYRKVFGLADVEHGVPASADSVFLIASLSKPFTALAVLRLAEQGLLSLDDPVSMYLPELERFGDGVTIRHLLQHTSGLPDYYLPGLWEDLAAITPYPTNTDGLELLSTHGEARFAPGDQFYYLNGGFEALAVLVERVAQQRFSDFQQGLFFDPLAMRASFSLPRPEREATAPYAYSYKLAGGSYVRYEYDASAYMYGAGDVVSNADDLLRFARGVFAGEVINLEQLEESFVPTLLNNGSEALVPYIQGVRYGEGWFLGQVSGQRYAGHAGIYLGYRTYLARFLDEDLTVIVLTAGDVPFFAFVPSVVAPIAAQFLPASS